MVFGIALLGRKCPFWANLIQNVFSLSINLALSLIQIRRIQ